MCKVRRSAFHRLQNGTATHQMQTGSSKISKPEVVFGILSQYLAAHVRLATLMLHLMLQGLSIVTLDLPCHSAPLPMLHLHRGDHHQGMLNAGAFYWVDIFMRFRMGFCVVYNLKRELIMDGGLIAHFYVRHDTFLTDFIAACPAIPEVRLLPPP